MFDWTGLAAELQNAFQQHLLAKYAYKGQASCSMGSPNGRPASELQADMQRQYSQFRAQGKKIVETGFTMASPGITLAYGCFGVAKVRRAGMPDSTYYLTSKVFRLKPGDHGAELSNAWIDHLKSIHPGWYFQSPGCLLLRGSRRAPGDLRLPGGVVRAFEAEGDPGRLGVCPGRGCRDRSGRQGPGLLLQILGSKPKTVFITPVRAADPKWERMDYQYAWQKYVLANLDKEAFTGGCEAGTMKQETVARWRGGRSTSTRGTRCATWTGATRPLRRRQRLPARRSPPPPPPPPPPAGAASGGGLSHQG